MTPYELTPAAETDLRKIARYYTAAVGRGAVTGLRPEADILLSENC